MNENKELLRKVVKVELARRSFYHYCQLMMPDFYKDDRTYLKTLANSLQHFWFYGEEEIMIINLPPRFGKSLTMMLFCQWLLGMDNQTKIIEACYNETLSSEFSKSVRNGIQEIKGDKDRIVYNDVFDTKIKKGDGAAKLWSVDGAYKSYLATSPSGTVTGFGGNIIIDDLIKNSEEAMNETILEKHFDWFTNTMLSRLEKSLTLDGFNKTRCIIMFTRWSKKDLCARVIDYCERNGKKYVHINMRAQQEDGTLLCEDILDERKIQEYKELMSEAIFEANYNQMPIDIKGQLYTRMNTFNWSEVFEIEEQEFDTKTNHNRYIFKVDNRSKRIFKINFERVIACIDWAGKGEDYCTCIVAGIFKKKIYILDILYTKLHEQQTAPLIEQMLREWEVHLAIFESNSGGDLFAQEIDRLRVQNGNKITQIITFSQTKNKMSRILSIKDFVMDNCFFMEDFSIKHRDAFKSYVEFQAVGVNEHDDFEDCISLVAEKFIEMGYYPY